MKTEQMNNLMKALDLGEVISNPTEVTGGLLHKMYRVVTSKNTYAVKVLNSEIMKRQDALKNTINSEKIAAAIAEHTPVIAALKINNRQIHELDGCHYMVFDWMEGKSLFTPDITEYHCEAIGDILGKMHHLNVSIEGVVPEEDDACLYEWEKYLQLANNQGISGSWLSKYEAAIGDIIEWNQQVCKAQELLTRRLVISHRDLDPKNVMWNNSKPFIIDWEAAGYVNPYQELLEVINYWADDGNGGLNKNYFDALIKAYEKYMNLAEVEWDSVLAGSFIGMLGWLEYNVKRSIGMEVSNNEEVKAAEEQVIGTINELYHYQDKVKLLKEWLVYGR